MTSSGNPKPKRPNSLLFLIGSIAVVAIACWFGVQMLSILYAILLPPAPPLVGGVNEISYTQTSHGVDEWLYLSQDNACKVALFYAQQSPDSCAIPPFCVANSAVSGLNRGMNVSRCSGEMAFSSFLMQWRVVIGVDDQDINKTLIRLSREVFWGGEAPPNFDELMPPSSQD